MDDVTTSLVAISDDIATASDASVGRAATVVEVDGNAVRVKFSDEDVAGESWFPSVVANLPVDTWGTVEPIRGNAGYFVPIGVPYFDLDADGLIFPNSGAEFVDVAGSYAGIKDGPAQMLVYENGTVALFTGGVGNAGVIVTSPSGTAAYSNISVIEAAPTSASHLTRKDYVDGQKPFSTATHASPAAETLTGVGTYGTAGVLRTSTLTGLFPTITTGTWDVDVIAYATVFRTVTTGGVYLFLGNGTTADDQVLGRLSDQSKAYTLTISVSRKGVLPGGTIDLRYTGFSTAGTTQVVTHGWQVTARRA